MRNRTGRWFLTTMVLTRDLTAEEIAAKEFSKDLLKKFTMHFSIRAFSSGCYYFRKPWNAWVGHGMTVSTLYVQIYKCCEIRALPG